MQLTASGAARSAEDPSLSSDGRRLAYIAHRCDTLGDCKADLIVEEVGGAGRSTLVHDWEGMSRVQWSADDRFLVIDGWERAVDGAWGPYVLPALGGGRPTFLGCCGGRVTPFGDTLLNLKLVAGDSMARIRWIALADGVARDSLAIERQAAVSLDVRPFPDRRRLLLVRSSRGTTTLSVMTREGREFERREFKDSRFSVVGLSPDGSAVLAARARIASDELDVLAYRVRASGQIEPQADTVLRQLRGAVFPTSNGMLLQVTGTSAFEVWAMRRENPAHMRFRQTRLLSSATFISGFPSPGGDRVATWRQVTVGGRQLVQLGLMPADGGPEVPLGPPRDLLSWAWSTDGTSLILPMRRGADRVDIETLDIASGRSHSIGRLAANEYGSVTGTTGGGMIVIGLDNQELRRVSVPGMRDTTFVIPGSEGTVEDVAASPDGQDLVTIGLNPDQDSVVVARMSLVTGNRLRLAAVAAFSAAGHASWLTDGTVEFPVYETVGQQSWYRVSATGGSPRRLGTSPRDFQVFRMSADGRLVVGRVVETKFDIYLIRNFAEMLPRGSR